MALSRFLLVRHGQTSWNKNNKYQGQTNIPLNDIGKEQAYHISKRLAKEKLNAVYSSDLDRAIETAHIIAKPHNLEVIPTEDMREINFGSWEGYNFEQIMRIWPEQYQKWINDPWNYNPPGGESLGELTRRVKNFMLKTAARHPGQNVLVVSHAGPIRAFLSVILELKKQFFWKFKISNASLTIVNYDGEEDDSFIVTVNDTSHLDI